MFDEERFRALLNDYFDELLEGEDRLCFERMLQSTARARELFWEGANQHALSREWALSSLGSDLANVVIQREESKALWKRRLYWGSGAAVAVAAALAAVIVLPRSQPKVPAVVIEQKEPVALLALSAEASWGQGNPRRLVGDALDPGKLRLNSGTIRIDFYSGARVWLRGPAEAELISAGELRLSKGVLMAEVPPAAEGFRVVSGDTVVTDFGTEFGILTSEKEKEIHVFRGSVEVKSLSDPQFKRDLPGGRALKLEGKGWRGIAADNSEFPNPDAISRGLAGEQEARFSDWQVATAKFSKQPQMLIHYLFSPNGNRGRIPNLVPNSPSTSDGILIGGEWSLGRWERKTALSFNGENDRVRLVLPGEYEALTWLVWTRLDALPEHLAAFWRVQDLKPGCVRWNVDHLGRLRMGVYTGRKEFSSPNTHKDLTEWDLAISKPTMDRELGRWVHLAGVYDSKNRVIELWLNGEKVAHKELKYELPAIMGVAQIGSLVVGEDLLPGDLALNSGATIQGRMDEFAVMGRAMTPAEIRAHYRQGKPRDARNQADPTDW
jgi:hypothetical protein